MAAINDADERVCKVKGGQSRLCDVCDVRHQSICTEFDPREMAQAINGLLADPDQLARMKRNAVIAARVLDEPALLLADEPTGNLDPDLAVDIMRLFREINARGTTVLVATHDRDLIERMQRRTVILEHGHVVAGGELP